MSGRMIKYHVLLPVCVFVVALVVGAPIRTALVVGMTTGCMSMLLMMAVGGHSREQQHIVSPAGSPAARGEAGAGNRARD